MLEELESKAREAVQRFPTLKGLWILCHDHCFNPRLVAQEFVTMIKKSYPRRVFQMDGFDCTVATPIAEAQSAVKDIQFSLYYLY